MKTNLIKFTPKSDRPSKGANTYTKIAARNIKRTFADKRALTKALDTIDFAITEIGSLREKAEFYMYLEEENFVNLAKESVRSVCAPFFDIDKVQRSDLHEIACDMVDEFVKSGFPAAEATNLVSGMFDQIDHYLKVAEMTALVSKTFPANVQTETKD